MPHVSRCIPLLLGVAFLFLGCQDDITSSMRAPESNSVTAQSASAACVATGTGLTAKVVNQDVIGQTIDVDDCDVGAFFDEDGVVKNATFIQDEADPTGGPSVQYAVRVDGADVDVAKSSFDVVDDYVHQFVAIGYRDGATGTIFNNTITGFHRVGILLDGTGTSATVKGNEVTGIGQKTDGWAENGIQVSRGATGTVNNNKVTDHWWDKNNFVSSGIIVFGSDEVTAQRNTLDGNDASLILFGDRNNFIHNTVEATAPDGSKDGTSHFGAFVSGENNGLRQNDFMTGTSANVGIFIFSGSVNTKLIRNSFSGGFGTKIFDGGDETKLPRPFQP